MGVREGAIRILLFVPILVLAWSPGAKGRDSSATEEELRQRRLEAAKGHAEFPVPPPAPGTIPMPRSVEPAPIVTRGPYTSVQVNVNFAGNNIMGDAANEPSLAIDPSDPSRLVIGWRQFDTIESGFRQAGWAYSHDSGATWTSPGVIEPGIFRSDPVLAADADGNFYYYSLTSTWPSLSDFACTSFKSIDGGASWLPGVFGFGGDKQWMTIDRTNGIGRGNIYAWWNVLFTCCPPFDFARSTNGGASFDDALAVPVSIMWGTLDVGPDGSLYGVGTSGALTSAYFVVKSTNAQLPPPSVPVFDQSVQINLGGRLEFQNTPNGEGLLGQLWIATDHSDGPTSGNVYVLSSINRDDSSDPLDVMFTRSEDGGLTWSPPIRVNDDNEETHAWQWFGTMSVAPNGRIDAIWNDTRNDAVPVNPESSEVFYSFSVDGGRTWSRNVPVTPPYNHQIGRPNGSAKIGDYYHMISDDLGANLAYAATFNGEQDVYFLRITRDCNANGIADEIETAMGITPDCNGNATPDECDRNEDCDGNGVQDICDIAAGTHSDCNDNEIIDECEPGGGLDCNGNGTIDFCDLFLGLEPDCNGNGRPDDCDIADGTSGDCTANGMPDECEVDCNLNGSADTCDILSGVSQDVDGDGVPDECGPIFVLVPVSATSGSPIIEGNKMTIVGGTAASVTLEVRIAFWDLDTDGDPVLEGYQAVVDTSGFASGAMGALSVAEIPCASNSDCFDSADCLPSGVCEDGASVFIDVRRPDYPFSPLGVITAAFVDVTGINMGTVIFDATPVTDPGVLEYAGTILVDVPPEAEGTFTIDFSTAENSNLFFLLSGGTDVSANALTVPAVITVLADCNGNGIDDATDIATGNSPDCNVNDVPDECDLTSGILTDSDMNGTPDECGACCDATSCAQTPVCSAPASYLGDQTICEQDCPATTPIPTISEWGLVTLGLLMLAAGSVLLARPRVPLA